jgi:RNA polymerase sigma-70 factor (ECF subfamily)
VDAAAGTGGGRFEDPLDVALEEDEEGPALELEVEVVPAASPRTPLQAAPARAANSTIRPVFAPPERSLDGELPADGARLPGPNALPVFPPDRVIAPPFDRRPRADPNGHRALNVPRCPRNGSRAVDERYAFQSVAEEVGREDAEHRATLGHFRLSPAEVEIAAGNRVRCREADRPRMASRVDLKEPDLEPPQDRERPPAPEAPSDGALLIRARDGERGAQEELYRRYVRMVYGLVLRMHPREAEVDDVVQDVFVIVLARFDRIDNPQAFAAFLQGVAVRTILKRVRRERLLRRLGLRAPEPLEPDLLISEKTAPDVAAEARILYVRVERLPAEERVAFLLRKVEGLELTTIAEQMGISLATVKRRLARAEALIQEGLQ